MRRSLLLMAVLGLLLGLCRGDAPYAPDASYASYGSYAVFQVQAAPSSPIVLELLDMFDVWGVSSQGYDVFAPKAEFLEFMRGRLEPFKMLDVDVAGLISQERARLQSAASKKAGWFEEYHDYNETYSWYQGLAKENPTLATFIPSIGKTWLSRDIFAFRITASSAPDHKKVWIQCNIHAREWITNACCQYVVNELITGFKSDPTITKLLEEMEFIFIPIVNPDGYQHTWTTDRMWRKNRRNNGGSYGVDLNRNFDQQWGGVGSSPSPASDTYMGPSAGSEPETQALSNYFNSQTNVVGAIDVHSYSQYILRPYTHTSSPSADEANIRQVSEEMADIIRGVHGKRYTPGIWYSLLYPSSGVAQDYYYVRGSYGLTVELRPTSPLPGFVLPPEEIIPTGQEITPAIVHFSRFCLENNKNL